MAPSLRPAWIPRTDEQRERRRFTHALCGERRKAQRRQHALRYTGDCVCTHEGAIRPQCMAGIFGLDCGTHYEYTSTGCEFDTVTLLAKRPARF